MRDVVMKVKNRYSSLSAPVKAAAWFTVCSFMQKGISFITVPIFTRLMTTEQFGVFSVYNSWYSILSIVMTLNLSAGVYNNCLTKYSGQRAQATSALQGLSTTVTAVMFVIYLANINFWNQLLHLSTLFVVLMFIENLFTPAYLFWTAEKRYDYKYIGIVIITLIISVGSPIVGIVAVLCTEYKTEARVLSFALIQAIVGLIFYIYNFQKGRKFFQKEYWLFALRFNIPLIPHYLSMTVLNQADRIMISQMVSDSAAAVYSIAYSVSNIMSIITSSINNSFIPYTYKVLKVGEYHKLRENSNALLLFICVFSILTMAFGPEVILIMGGKEYYDAIWVIPPVAASVFFTFLYPLFANIEFYFEKTMGIMVASCIGAVTNIVLNYYFIGLFGYYAAGYTTLVCYILFDIFHYIFQKRILTRQLHLKKNIYDIRMILILSAVELICMLLMTLVYTNFLIRYLIILLIAVVCIINRKYALSIIRNIKSNK